MSHKTVLGAFALAGSLCCGFAYAESLSFIGTTDKNPLEYKLNETMKFTVTLVDKANNNVAVTGKNLRWTLTDDGGQKKSGTALSDTPLVVTHSMTNAGFTRLVVEVQTNGVWLSEGTEFFDGGAGADIGNIPEYAAPADLASFWQTATNLLYATPFTGEYAPVCTNFSPSERSGDGVDYYLFELPMPNDTRPATGIIAMPQNAANKSCGIVAQVNGYGFGATGVPTAANVLAGNGYIYVAITRHGEYPVSPDAAYYTQVQSDMSYDRNGVKKSFCWRNNDTGDAKDTDFYKMLMRDLRALQYMKGFAQWNGKYIKTTGGSMGGYQSIGMASLDKDVTECSASIPWCVDLSGGVKFGRQTGWRPEWTETLGYVDLKNLAKLCTCKVTFSAGLGDYVCPPSGEVLLFKSLPKPKKVTYTQNMGHGSTHGPNCASYSFEEKDPEPVVPVTHRTLDWLTDTGNWSVAANWKDVEGNTNAVPRDGDIINAKKKKDSQKATNDLTGLKPYRVNVGGGFHFVQGNEITFVEGSYGIHNEGYMYYNQPIAVEGTNVTMDSTSFLVFGLGSGNKIITSANGEPCGIVKTGSGSAGHQPPASGNVTWTGFKYITVKEGAWCFNVNGGANAAERAGNVYPENVEFTFAKAGTMLMVGGNLTIRGLTLHETGTAVGANHTICQQGGDQYGTIVMAGTPSLDKQVFTGTVTGKTGFMWAPADSTKEFEFKGGVSGNTGKLGVRNGTLRLTDGATFTALSELEVSGGANSAFVVADTPSKTFKAAKLTIGTGAESVSFPAGMTLAVETMTVAEVRMAAGTYTRANTTWLTGDGTVTVAGVVTGQTMVWSGQGGDGLWSNANNWTNTVTGAHEVPYAGDLIDLSAAGAVTVDLASGTTFTTPQIILGAGTTFSVPAGVTLVATQMLRNGARIAPGTYTSGAWVAGGGTVRVETLAACHLKWSGKAGDKKWSSANNWVNQTTMMPDVPQNGDTLTLASGGNTQNNDLVGLKPYKVIPAGNGTYSNPTGNALIFEEGSWGIENGGYMYYQIPTIVRAKKITMYCSSNAGYTTSIYNDQGNTFGFEKTGTGLFAFKTGVNEDNPRYTGLKDILLTAGTLAFGWQSWGEVFRMDPGIEVTFNGADTNLRFDQNTIFTNFVIRESSSAAGKTHAIGVQDANAAKALTFTICGAPALTPMTFTGDIVSPLSFTWAPDNATNEFVFSGQEVTCTNTITAAGGVMRLTGGASFTKLGTLELKGGALTTFIVDTVPTKTFHVKNLVLETGLETLRVEAGVKLYFDTLTVAGETMPAGVYVHTGRVGQQAAWAVGGGYICVGGADMPTEPTGAAVAATWTANGSDTKVGTAANWQGAELPDLDSGLVAATFSAGTGADLDQNAKFKAMTLNAPGAWAFTASNPNVYAFLGSGGLTTAGTGKTYDFGWPIFLWNSQTWNIGNGDKIVLNGNLDSAGGKLTVNGGTLDCNAQIAHGGAISFSNTVVNLNVDDALGTSATQPVEIDMASSKINFNGVTLNRTLKNTMKAAGDGCIYVKAGTTNVLNGDLDVSLPVQNKINMAPGAFLRIKGNVKRATTAWFTFGGSGDGNNRATIHLDSNTVIKDGSAFQCANGLDIYFNAPSNQLGGVWFWFSQSGSTLHTTVPYAFVKKAGGTRSVMKCGSANAEWDMHGGDQELAQLQALSPFRITSEKPALLHLATDVYNYPECITNSANFKGGAGVSFDGTQYMVLNGVCDSTGTVQVTKGELKMLKNAKWPNASAAVVKSGKMTVAASSAFGDQTTFDLNSAGKLDLAAGVRIKVKKPLVLDGVTVTEKGTYGSTASAAEFKSDQFFTGTGVVKYGPRIGTIIITR